jgi:light-regulated signal transduction histidine kinase (bacteriophytochrome)
MAELIDNMLQLSRVTRHQINREPVDVSALACALAADLEKQHPDRTATISVEPDITAYADSSLLRIALANLLDNSWKFTAREKETLIQVGLLDNASDPVLFVRDNGAGFDMAYAEKLFVPFQRLHRTEDFAGTGIGLSIVQRVVTRHGGSVRAESEPGQGATFFITLENLFRRTNR